MSFRQFCALGILCILTVCGVTADATADLSLGRQILLDRGLQIQSLGFIDSTPVAPSTT